MVNLERGYESNVEVIGDWRRCSTHCSSTVRVCAMGRGVRIYSLQSLQRRRGPGAAGADQMDRLVTCPK